MRLAATLLSMVAFLPACSRDATDLDASWSAGLALVSFEPEVLVPGVQPKVVGDGLVTETLGTTRVHFVGAHAGPAGPSAVDVSLAASVVSATQLVLVDPTWTTLCAAGEGRFSGSASLEVTSRQTEEVHESPSLLLNLTCSETLTPQLSALGSVSAVQLNAPVSVVASNLLIGDTEGTTTAELSGCFQRDGTASCDPVGPVEVPVASIDGLARTGGLITLPPTLVGLKPGDFDGEVTLLNRHTSGEVTRSDALSWSVSVLPSYLESVEAAGASMGGIVVMEGAGLVGASDDAGTEVFFSGIFSPDDGSSQRSIDLILVPSYSAHDRLNYVLDEQDTLGQVVDLRTESGSMIGTFSPRFYLGGETQSGPSIEGSFRIEPLRQVVWLNLTPSYTDGLLAFGLREVSEPVKAGILTVIEDIYAGINVDIRLTEPEDYVLYSRVDVTGVDPNGFGLLGYDNSPGKDNGNARLYDRIGGLNALTQQDGYPGYGGVFLESIWAFSLAPPTSVTSFAGASQRFDDVFDPVRADLGTPVTLAEAAAFTPLRSGAECTGGGSRELQVRCAVWSISHIVGSTIAHELAHSFGLADPGGNGFHNTADAPGRLMDSGDARPFVERAGLEGPAESLCQGNFDYLRGILPSGESDPATSRSACN